MNLENINIEDLKDKIAELRKVAPIIQTNEEKINDLKKNNNFKLAGYVFVQMFNMFLSNLSFFNSDTGLYLLILNHLIWAYVGSIYYGTFYSNVMNIREIENENKRLTNVDIQNQNEINLMMNIIRKELEEVYLSEENKMYEERINELHNLKFALLSTNENQNVKKFVYKKR